MTKTTRILAKFVYGVNGAAFLAAGATILLVNTGLLPVALRNVVIHFSQDNLGMLHILQEFGTILVFAGLLTFWFIRHYEQSRFFHWALTAYWALMAIIHWFNVAGPSESVIGPLVNTVPFLLFLTIGLLRSVTEKSRAQERSEESACQIARRQHTASGDTLTT